jgi:hypothetical protein
VAVAIAVAVYTMMYTLPIFYPCHISHCPRSVSCPCSFSRHASNFPRPLDFIPERFISGHEMEMPAAKRRCLL